MPLHFIMNRSSYSSHNSVNLKGHLRTETKLQKHWHYHSVIEHFALCMINVLFCYVPCSKAASCKCYHMSDCSSCFQPAFNFILISSSISLKVMQNSFHTCLTFYNLVCNWGSAFWEINPFRRVSWGQTPHLLQQRVSQFVMGPDGTKHIQRVPLTFFSHFCKSVCQILFTSLLDSARQQENYRNHKC